MASPEHEHLEGEVPVTPPSRGDEPDTERDEFADRCRDERETLTGKETARCAGEALSEEYEREEDGGT